MLKNFFKTAIRNLLKHKGFSIINIFGLAIGMAASLMILQYVTFEISYDKFHKNARNIFRLQQNRYNEGKLSTQWAAGAAGAGPALKEAFPEIESFAKLTQSRGIFSYKDQKYREEKIFFANEDFLPIFSYKTIKGKAADALKEPYSAVITASIAKKYFNNEDPLGKTISFNKKDDFKITGVVEDMPPNTHLKFDVLLSFSTFLKLVSPEADRTWEWDGFFTYLLLKPGTDPSKLENKIARFLETGYGKTLKDRNEGIQFKLQPLTDIHLYSNYMLEAEANGDGRSTYFLLVIALFIVVIAWINYINLSTARSLDRGKEVGVRKVMGSFRAQLMGQFMFESLLINFFAVVTALILVLVSLPLFNSLTGKQVSFSLLSDAGFWLALTALFLVGTCLSGLYPAFVLSSFKPIEVLKGRLIKTAHGAFLRQSLVILQFAASIALMVGTFCVYRQVNYMQKQDLGIDVNQTLVLKGPAVTDSTYRDKLSAFKTEMKKLAGVSKIAASTEVPGRKVAWNAGGIRLEGSAPNTSNQYRPIGIDYDFVDVFKLKVLKGRNFSREHATDTQAVMLNEAAARLMGFTRLEDALNRRIEFWGQVYSIIGIVSNHHQQSLRENFDVHIFRLMPYTRNYYSIKVDRGGSSWKQIVANAKTQWEKFFPDNPYEYFFLDEKFHEQYNADRQFGKTFALFSILAIIVACLGLLGLASFVTTQRTKEIGIRKISGAGLLNILLLLTKDFIRPVLISFLIATPITYYLLKSWLQNYAFKISLNPWMFILPAILILLIAIMTISTQTIKAASANPVKSLRTE